MQGSPSIPPAAKGKWGMDKVEVEVPEQPNLVVKGVRGEGEAHAVVQLDVLGELVDDVCNTREHGELGL